MLLLASAPASAEVVSASSNGFEVRETVPLVVPPEAAFKAFGELPAWWDPQHTYSGDSANLRLQLTPGGCFCERIPKSGGGVEHMHVAYVEPSSESGLMDVTLHPNFASNNFIYMAYAYNSEGKQIGRASCRERV